MRAKNIILIISDGQGYNGWLAADFFEGKAGRQSYQQRRPDGTMPVHVAKAQRASYFVDAQGEKVLADEQLVPSGAVGIAQHAYDPESFWAEAAFEQRGGHSMDSAASATALASGRWTSNGRLNTSWDGEDHFETIVDLAKAQGKRAGVLTTVQASHATPAGMVARQAKRGNYEGIFQQMAARLDVIIGCGHPDFDNDGQRVEAETEEVYQFLGGPAYLQAMRSGELGMRFVERLEDIQQLTRQPVEGAKLMIAPMVRETLQQRRQQQAADVRLPSGMALSPHVPSLDALSQVALRQLSSAEEGFFLLIEGGAVDWAHHDNNFPRAIEEQLALNQAIEGVIAWVERHSSWQETLLIISADHETGALWGSSQLPEAGVIDPACLAHYLRPMQDLGRGKLMPHHYHVGGHSNNLVPLWALGVGSHHFLERNSVDQQAAALWGHHYHWDGRFVEAVTVFDVMKSVL